MPSLLLHPRDPSWVPDDQDDFDSLLHRLGLSGDPRAPGEFQAGPRFLNLIMFLGCSPRVALEPAANADPDSVCCVRRHRYPQVSFLAAAKRPPVRCPACRAPAGEVDTRTCDRAVRCAACGQETRLAELDWRQAAGFGRFFVELTAIHPHEAVPSDKLLDSLHEHAGIPWRYFYIDQGIQSRRRRSETAIGVG